MKKVFYWLLLIVPTLGWAQSSTTTALPGSIFESRSEPFTLEECLQRSLVLTNAIKRGVVDSLAARLKLEEIRNQYLPTVGASIGQEFDLGRAEDSQGIFQQRSAAQTAFSIDVSWTAFSGLRRLYARQSALLQQEISNNLLVDNREKAILATTKYFYSFLLQQEVRRVAEMAIAETEQTLKYTRKMVESERWPLSKLLEVEARAANDQLNLISAENSIAIAAVALRQNVEYFGSEQIKVASPPIDQLVRESMGFILTADEVFAQAMEKRPSIRAGALNLEAIELQQNIARTGYFPTVSLRSGYTTSYHHFFGQGPNFNKGFIQQLDHNSRFYVGLTLQIPIFDAFQTSNQIRQAKLQHRLAQMKMGDYEMALYQEVHEGWANAEAARRAIAVTEQGAKVAQQNAEMMRIAFEAGKRTAYDLEQAESRFRVAEGEALKAKYNFIQCITILRLYAEGHPALL